MAKIISAKEACSFIKSGMTILIGGFLKCGTPTEVIKEILKTDIKDLTVVGNDTSFADSDRGLLVSEKRCKKVIASHIGTFTRQCNAVSMQYIYPSHCFSFRSWFLCFLMGPFISA